jgi:hypothetical protein
MSGKGTKSREIAKTEGRSPSSGLDTLPKNLGVVISQEDVFYLFLSGLDVVTDLDSLRQKTQIYADLLNRTIPDTQFTRLRLARLLEGLETISKALRVILTIEDFDVLAELRGILLRGLEDVSRSTDPSSGVTSEQAGKNFGRAISEALQQLRENGDPRVRNALQVLAEAGRILDVTQDLPRLPAVDALDIKRLQPSRAEPRPKDDSER